MSVSNALLTGSLVVGVKLPDNRFVVATGKVGAPTDANTVLIVATVVVTAVVT